MTTEASNEADREIIVSRMIEAPRRLVFDAFTSATHLAQWCAPKGGKITTRAFDFKPGGVWDATIQGPDGSEYPNHFVWKEIEPPERIVWMYGMGKDDPHPVKTSLTLAERGATTYAASAAARPRRHCGWSSAARKSGTRKSRSTTPPRERSSPWPRSPHTS
jgi:uncharacterized protein YndB with AHSA1/START domain